jgi:TatD DNase family protein
MYIDSHAHFDLTMEDGSIAEDMLMEQTRANNIVRTVQISIDAACSRWSRDFARRHAKNGVLFTIGIHPSSPADDNELNELKSLAEGIMSCDDSKLIFGIGECGLDFYRKRQPRESQERSFRFQIELANRLGLPVIVHSRESMKETLTILRETCRTTGIMHCFSGDRDDARKVLDLGFYISFAGNVTYRNAIAMQTSASYVPLERLLVETDSPFLTPVPLRGKKNRPEYVIHTYRFIAELRSEPEDRLAGAVYENFMELANHEAKKVQI